MGRNINFMPRPNEISGNQNYLGTGGHYKSGLAGDIPYGIVVDTLQRGGSVSTPLPGGLQDYMQSVQEFQANPSPYYPVTPTIGQWLQDNWKVVIGGAAIALILLPKGRR